MKIGINMGAYPIAVDEQVRLMKKYGFEATFSIAGTASFEEELAVCEQNGIVHETVHAPFRRINDIWLDTPEGEAKLSSLLRAVDACEQHGISYLVVHLSSGQHPPRINPLGISRFAQLMTYAKEHGVTIAYENQRLLSNISLAFEEFADARFCFDTGHQACFTPKIPFMTLFGDKTVAVHIHDNHAVFDSDEHLLPYDGTLKLEDAMRALAKTPYSGAIMLEVVATHTSYYKDTAAEEYYARAAAAAKRLRDVFLEQRGASSRIE